MSKSISVIVTGRNDNYDGNFDDRLAMALSQNIRRLPDAEFIFVCWNPVSDRSLTCENLKKVFGDRIRYYVVHPKFHDKYCNIDGFLEYPAKNVGVRRATGEFILCTNSDVILSPEVAAVTGLGDLESDMVYRATRVDIPLDYLDVCFPLPANKRLTENRGMTNASGDFVLAHRDAWFKATGYCEAFPEQRLHKDSFLIHILVEKFKMRWKDLGIITHWKHPTSWSSMTGTRPKVGDIRWDYKTCGFEKNPDTWGLFDATEEERDGIIWLV